MAIIYLKKTNAIPLHSHGDGYYIYERQSEINKCYEDVGKLCITSRNVKW